MDKKIKLNASIGKTSDKSGKEVFTWRRFGSGFFGLLDPIGWAKDIIGLFNVRKLVVYFIILSFVCGYGYWKGKQGQPVYVDIAYGKEVKMELNNEGDYLHIHKDGTVHVHDKKGNVLKKITVADIPGLKRKLKPIGFQLVPVGIMGGGIGIEGAAFEGGAGVSFFRYWKMQLEAFLTNKGIYLGSSYQITDNSGIGLGVGKGWKGDNRMILYYRWRF